MANSVGLNRPGKKRNLTVQLDEEIIQAAKELAVRRGTSVSGLVTQKLRELVEEHIRYEEAKQRALDAMRNPGRHGGTTWTREELYDEMFKG